MQVLARSTSSVRPRPASPGMPVSDCGIESPAMTYARNACSSAAADSNSAAIAAIAAAMEIANLAKCIHRDAVKPGTRGGRFIRAHLTHRFNRTGNDSFAFREHAVARLVDAGLREGVVGRDGAVAGPDQPRHFG